MKKPFEVLLPVDKIDPEISKILARFAQEISEAANMGTHIIKWDIDSNRGGEENLPSLMLMRHIIELVDSISVLIKQSSVDPCKIILRSILESYFSLEYLFEKIPKIGLLQVAGFKARVCYLSKQG